MTQPLWVFAKVQSTPVDSQIGFPPMEPWQGQQHPAFWDRALLSLDRPGIIVTDDLQLACPQCLLASISIPKFALDSV